MLFYLMIIIIHSIQTKSFNKIITSANYEEKIWWIKSKKLKLKKKHKSINKDQINSQKVEEKEEVKDQTNKQNKTKQKK